MLSTYCIYTKKQQFLLKEEHTFRKYLILLRYASSSNWQVSDEQCKGEHL